MNLQRITRRASLHGFSLLAAIAPLAMPCARTIAQGSSPQHPVTFAAATQPSGRPVAPGGRVTVVLDAHLLPGWHVYSMTTPPGGPIAATISIGPASLARLADAIIAPIPVTANDPNFGIVTETYVDSARFLIPVQVLSSARPGKRVIDVQAYYQTCNNRYCLPPATDTVRVSLVVAKHPPSLQPDDGRPPNP